MLVGMADMQLAGNVDANEHFNAPYNPWDQRLCLVPGGDLFAALRDNKAEVITDQIADFGPGSITLKSGRQIDADIVVSATGIQLRFLGGMQTFVDGRKVDSGELVNYRGTMFGGLPNFGSIFGYANASWTLKADLSASYFCRLLNYMRRKNLEVATPRLPEDAMELNPMLNLSSGYIKRSAAQFPKFGDSSPWKNFEYYMRDFIEIRFGRLRNNSLELR
jgi:cation diffusion facilitator CzcD-associated flavoprotein CzcO